MSKLRFYYDLMSQPSRALWIALRLGKTPHKDCPVALRKREQLTEEYKKINRFQKVPCIVDGNFQLSESVAILRYLVDKGSLSESLYPKQIEERARVDEFLEWQHLTLRLGCSMYFVQCWLLPMNGLAPNPTPEKRERLLNDMENNLNLFQKHWLSDTEFLVGNRVSAADLFGACEILQTKLPKYDVGEKYPKIDAWLQRVRAATNPHFDEAHKYIYKKSA